MDASFYFQVKPINIHENISILWNVCDWDPGKLFKTQLTTENSSVVVTGPEETSYVNFVSQRDKIYFSLVNHKYRPSL